MCCVCMSLGAMPALEAGEKTLCLYIVFILLENSQSELKLWVISHTQAVSMRKGSI